MATLTFNIEPNDLLQMLGFNKPFYDAVRSFVHSINPKIKVRISHDEFYAECGNNLINICIGRNGMEDEIFDDFIQRKFGISVNPFLMGILHEVGHIMTFDEDLDQDRSILYFMLQINFKEERWKEYSDMYFQIPAEFEATTWAVNYYLSHKDYCDNFLKEIGYEA